MKWRTLRARSTSFVYESYGWKVQGEDLVMSFHFRLASRKGPDIHFRPEVRLKHIDRRRLEKLPAQFLSNLVFHLGLAEMPSYWKAAISPEILISCASLYTGQIRFWEDLFWKGLAEFSFTNKITLPKREFVKIKSTVPQPLRAPGADVGPLRLQLARSFSGVLIPLGGGKDSIVTLERMKKRKRRIGALVLNPGPAHQRIMRIASVKYKMFAERTLDSKLLALNRRGYLNGHTPFSAYLSFLAVLAAVLGGWRQVAMSQESSADEANLIWRGRGINHQYSKSSEFERKFREYLKAYLVEGLQYSSALRHLSELEIAKLFSRYPQYFSAFRSCNRGLKEDRWCEHCPKCLFSFLILYPWLSEDDRKKIFKKNLLDEPVLLPLAKRFLGIYGFKPFECVGARKEIKEAFCLGIKKAGREKESLPYILEKLKPMISCEKLI